MPLTCSRLLLALILASAMSACTLSELVTAPKPVQETVAASNSSPAVGVISVARVGENIFSDSRLELAQAFTATLLDEASGTLPVGRKVRLEKGYAAQLQRSYDGFNSICYSYKEMTLHTECLVDKNGSDTLAATFASTFTHARAAEQKGDFAITKPARYVVTPNKLDPTRGRHNFKRVLTFQGISKGAVNILYSEFANDLAHPASTQELTYELTGNGSADIAFKGLRIKIMQATSAELTYVVLKSFSNAPQEQVVLEK